MHQFLLKSDNRQKTNLAQRFPRAASTPAAVSSSAARSAVKRNRVITPQTSLGEACKCVLVSFDSTMCSNLSVGPPLDLLLYRRDRFTANLRQRLVEDDPYLQTIRREWNETLRRGVRELPSPEWLRDAEG